MVSDIGIRYFSLALSSNSSLTRVSLRNNMITQEGAHLLVDGILRRKLEKLSLDLMHNRIVASEYSSIENRVSACRTTIFLYSLPFSPIRFLSYPCL